MTKRTLVSVGAAALILIGLGYWLSHRANLTKPLGDYSQAPGATVSSAKVTSDPVAQAAWQAFRAYLAAAKAHDLSTLRTYTYKLSSVCADHSKQAQCFAAMDRVYKNGSSFNEGDFTHITYDARQIILSTDWKFQESDVQMGYGREVIYFVRTSDGSPKVLFFTQPQELIYSFIDPTASHAQLVSRLEARLKDTDGDYVEDEYETCSYQGAASSTPACVPTDPNKMDTNNNGWWDSIEQYLH